MAAELARAVRLLERVSHTEKAVAQTLHRMAQADGSDTAARRLRLAGEAIHGAQTAIEYSERLQQHARQWKEHGEVIRLHWALSHAASVLADLARTETDIADTLTSLAGRDGSGLAVHRLQLADQARASAQRAYERAQALRQLAGTSAAGTPPA